MFPMFHKIKCFILAWLFTMELLINQTTRQQLAQADQNIEQGNTVKLRNLP